TSDEEVIFLDSFKEETTGKNVASCNTSYVELTAEDMIRLMTEISDWGSFADENEENIENESKFKNERKFKNEFKEKETNIKMASTGRLEIFMGPMFSGKSTQIMFKLSCMADQRFRCLYINSIKDVRKTETGNNDVTSHNSSYSKLSPKIVCMKVNNLDEVDVSNYDYIAVDEFQFYEKENTVGTVL